MQISIVMPAFNNQKMLDRSLTTLKAHFPIYTARKQSGDILTQYEITYGLFEFWRDNGLTPRDRWENTLQTVRRRVRVTVVALSDTEVKIDLVVEKERRDRAREGARFSFARSARSLPFFMMGLLP